MHNNLTERTLSKLLFIIFCFLVFYILVIFQTEALASDEALKKENLEVTTKLQSQHLELLMEKGIVDDQGEEIDDRLSKMIENAKEIGLESGADITGHILDRLNYAETNLGNFPQCAFDRPIGFKLKYFGHTVAPENIDAKAEGSACPAGGIGAGSFEWTMSGNFRYWFLKSGWMVDDTVWADQFHVYMKKGDDAVVQTLSTDAPPQEELQSWKWNYPAGRGSYYALFPKSGFSYEENDSFPAKIAVTQFSPIIPHNYKETSYPVAVYKWIVENPEDQPVEVSVMLTWQNMVGWEPYAMNQLAHPADFVWDRKSKGNFNQFVQEGDRKGILFGKKDIDIKRGNALTGTMCIAAQEIPGKIEVFYHTDFDPQGTGSEVWDTFSKNGTLSNSQESRTAGERTALAGALAVRLILEPGERLEFPMVVTWDFPYYEFQKGVKYRKKYTAFFGAEGKNAFRIASEALENYQKWEAQGDAWQGKVIKNPDLPDWFKQALFNELYILSETSLWDASTDLHTYLESIDYLMYGTFDVDAYSSWHLLKLWPKLEMSNIEFFARTVDWEDPAYKVYIYPDVTPNEVPEDKMHYYWNTNKVYGMIPHDIGSPRSRPWTIVNAFNWQNGNVWKDLNPKFPLRGFRDYLYTGAKDLAFLRKIYRTSVIALDTLEKRFGHPDNHIPLNEGIPDQTYDTWKMKGESAYVSVLWLAALKATSRMGELLIEKGMTEADGTPVSHVIEKYGSWFETGRVAFQKLWNEKGGYFNVDSHLDDIMADQLFGIWYTKLTGLEEKEDDRIAPLEQVKKTLQTIYEKNVIGFGKGLMGAVNGRKADGTQHFSIQGDEVWTGTTYAYASNCILHGLKKEGMHAAYGVYSVVYGPYGQGYFFKTPEAYRDPEEFVYNDRKTKHGDKLFRAMKYMRPGAIWAVYEALKKNLQERQNMILKSANEVRNMQYRVD
jgi:non-lysosomal glucosylceramidase